MSSESYMEHHITAVDNTVHLPSQILMIIGNFLNYKCRVGDHLYVCDSLGNPYEATVQQIHGKSHQICVRYELYGPKWDEWIDSRSDRIISAVTT